MKKKFILSITSVFISLFLFLVITFINANVHAANDEAVDETTVSNNQPESFYGVHVNEDTKTVQINKAAPLNYI